MADLALIAALAANGIEPADAKDMVDRVTEALVERLALGKPVLIDGVGVLKAPEKEASAGFPPGHRRKQRRVQIRGAVLWKGLPYPDTREQSTIRISGAAR